MRRVGTDPGLALQTRKGAEPRQNGQRKQHGIGERELKTERQFVQSQHGRPDDESGCRCEHAANNPRRLPCKRHELAECVEPGWRQEKNGDAGHH